MKGFQEKGAFPVLAAVSLVLALGPSIATAEDAPDPCRSARGVRATARLASAASRAVAPCISAFIRGEAPTAGGLSACVAQATEFETRAASQLDREARTCRRSGGRSYRARLAAVAAPGETQGLVSDLLTEPAADVFSSDRSLIEKRCLRRYARRAQRNIRRAANAFAQCRAASGDAACADRLHLPQTPAVRPLPFCSASSALAEPCRGNGIAVCVRTHAACRACRAFVAAAGAELACDAIDDGALNASCEETVTPVVAPECGDGLVEPGEACDPAHPHHGACCSNECEPFAVDTPCTSDANVCTRDVCDDAGRCTHASTCSWTFEDVTSETGAASEHAWVRDGLVNPELERLIVSGGVAAGDPNGDSHVDLFTIGGPAGSSALLMNDGAGGFVDEAALRGVDLEESPANAPLFADLDGDGDDDLLVPAINGGSLRLYENTGGGDFAPSGSNLETAVDFDVFSATAGDYDTDGDLDLFLSAWAQQASAIARLWRNDGGFVFTDVTEAAGLDIYRGFFGLELSFAVHFADIDGDVDLDLLIASDFGSSQVFRNAGDGTFEETTSPVIDDENGMGAAVADYDADGDMDWFVSSIFDPTGMPPENWGATGNRLYANDGTGVFTNVTDRARIADGRWGWGSCFADFNLDGHVDVFHTNGYSAEAASVFFEDASRLFIADGLGGFDDRAAELGLIDTAQGRGVVCFDYDGDGDIDVFVANNEGPARLWRNGAESLGNTFLAIRPLADSGGPAIGAVVEVHTRTRIQARIVEAGGNYASQDPPVAHFGLGDRTRPVEVRVLWPDGRSARLTKVSPGATVTIAAPTP